MTDLFGHEPAPAAAPLTAKELRRSRDGRGTRPKARASALPGPAGESCRSCRHAYGRRSGAGKKFYKCAIAQRAATSGSGTDIRLKDPACARWEREDQT